MTIGILYVCTGKYTIFWDEFYTSFKKNFCKSSEKKFFVFTDANDLKYADNQDVRVVYQEQLGWPYDTLMRFSMFNKAKNELSECDYIYFFNANMVCEKEVIEEEILPCIGKGQQLVVVKHPGYGSKKMMYCPLERNSKSLAYIPYNKGRVYVCGGVNGGTASAYLQLINDLKERIDNDLSNGIIAKFHDESHLNKYILNREDVRVLTPEFCNPDDLSIPYEKKIRLLDKRKYLNINAIKKITKESLIKKWSRRICKYSRCILGYICDTVKRK